MKTLAVIPARGGSKRVPRKNIRLFCGKPMISYSIDAALQSSLFDEVVVSTDDQEIASVSKQFGASVLYPRPDEISDDITGVMVVVAHALEQITKQGRHPNEVCMIYATAPMIRTKDLLKSYKKFQSTDKDFVFSAAEFAAPIFRSFTIQPDGSAKMLQPEYYQMNSQDLPPTYHDAAQFCWGRAEAIRDTNAVIYSERALPFVLPSYRVVDIDTPEDWQRAELLYQVNYSPIQ